MTSILFLLAAFSIVALAMATTTGSPDFETDAVAFIDRFITRTETGKPFKLAPYQRRLLALVLKFDEHNERLLVRLLLWGERKKSGKTAILAAIGTWWALTGHGDVTCLANDFDQAQGRVFATMVGICRQNGWDRPIPALGNKPWVVIRADEIRCANGAVIRAVASDFKGEAGGRQTLAIFDELWAVSSEKAERLWEEMTPIPTAPSAWVLVGTTAGFVGESHLLERLYRKGLASPRVDEELELYHDAASKSWMFWSHTARQPWQTEEYYAEQRASLRPSTYLRLHENVWVSADSSFIDAEMWDGAVDTSLAPLVVPDGRMVYAGWDVATKRDGTGFAAVAWNDEGKLELLFHRIWRAPVDLVAVEGWVFEQAERFNLTIVVDPFQTARSIATLKARGVDIEEFPQTVQNCTRMGEVLFDLLRADTLRVYPADDLRDQALSVVAVEHARGFRLAKEKASRKIDGISALAMACVTAVEHGPENSMPLMLAGGEAWREWTARGSSVPDDAMPEAEHEDEPGFDEGASAWARLRRSWGDRLQRKQRERQDANRQATFDATQKAANTEQAVRHRAALKHIAAETEREAEQERAKREAGRKFIERQIREHGAFWPNDFH